MKLKSVVLAIAALGVASAFAATTTVTAQHNVQAANIVYISGSSAVGSAFKNVVAGLCTGGAINVVEYSAGSAGKIEVCTTTGSRTGTPAAPFAVVKRDTNGSFDGVGPVINGTSLAGWPDVSVIDAAAKTTTATASHVPDGGLSDVDHNVWVGLSQNSGLSLPVPKPGTNIHTGAGFAGMPFGVMVTDAMYIAMQSVQSAAADGRLATTCAPAVGATAVAADLTGACQPSISRAEYSAIVNANATSYVVPAGMTGDNVNPVNICRRVETSGTQAVSNAYFLGNPCASGPVTGGLSTPKFVDMTTTGVALTTPNVGNYDDNGGALAIFEGSGTGDARNCMIARNTGKNPSNIADTLGKFAVGVIAADNVAPATGWKYVKLDNVSPNYAAGAVDATQRKNAVNGFYDLTAELEILWNTSNSHAAFMAALETELGNPTSVGTTLPGLYQVNGSNGGASTHALFPTQVSKGTRGGNLCAPNVLAE